MRQGNAGTADESTKKPKKKSPGGSCEKNWKRRIARPRSCRIGRRAILLRSELRADCAKKTTLTLPRIADLLKMGAPTYVSYLLYHRQSDV